MMTSVLVLMLFRMIVSQLTLFAKDIANGMANVAALGVTHKVFDIFGTVQMLRPVPTGVNDLLQILTGEITIIILMSC